ncbi:MAG: NIP7 N-terminal domain-related protein [Candidatus Hermodarchaeota archaeon]
MQNGKIRLTFTPPSAAEEEQILQGLAEYISEKAVKQFLKKYCLLLAKGRRVEVYLLSSTLWDLYQQIHSHRHPYFLGLFLGELSQGTLQPSLHVLAHLAESMKDSVRVVTNQDGEQQFLYGHQLKPQHITELPSNANKMTKLLVVNEHHEGLGYGQLKTTQTGEPRIKNQRDLGWYLRRGR